MMPNPHSLMDMSVEDLAEISEDGDFRHVACMGFVFRAPKQKCSISSHIGRDITARLLRECRGLPLDESDDMGKAPFPVLKDHNEDEIAFISSWLDHYYQFVCNSQKLYRRLPH